MRQNKNLSLSGEKTVLVPYEEHHVPKVEYPLIWSKISLTSCNDLGFLDVGYHDWMKSEELQLLTASEPLSLEQEYEMQKSWREDENKCTFIVIDADKFQGQTLECELDAMVGDVNLFFNDEDDKHTAEIEIMIAEECARGKGMGKEALHLMMKYGIEELKIHKFTAKIGYNNAASQTLFKKIGFKEISRSDVFQELTFDLPVCDNFTKYLSEQTRAYRKTNYREHQIHY